jgi:serine protease Do
MRRLSTVASAAVVAIIFSGAASDADAQIASDRASSLKLLSGAVEALSASVAPSVVQVLVTGFATVNEGARQDTDLVIGRQRTLGSGAIISADGDIVTNAHVVRGARRVQVVLQDTDGRSRTVDARIVGLTQELDLALLKINATGLVPLALADYKRVQQGQLVFAFGSPQGLRGTMTMGIVSARERQPDPDNPIAYIQTDAPIARGNSGGPLVNADGELVGINTFISTDSTTSQGVGFALPSSLVAMAVPKLRQYGRLHRGQIGVLLQTMTPALKEGLGLSRATGALVSDVAAGGPAAAVGLRVGDIIIGVDGEPVDGVLPLGMRLFTSNGTDSVRLRYQRGDEILTADVAVVDAPNDLDRLTDTINPEDSFVPMLGIMGATMTTSLASQLPSIRFPLGVIVAARAAVGGTADVSLITGDVIHGVNGEVVRNVEQLRGLLDHIAPGRPVVLQIERNGQFSFVAFDAD